jgi:hypothetical protein
MAHDRQPEAGAAGVATARPVDAVKALPDAFEIAARDTYPVVAHDKGDAIVGHTRADLDGLVGA